MCDYYTIPASSSSGWSTSDGNAKNVQYNNNETYGAYYTWCVATANTCVNSGTASSSVCPKGWKLPTHDEQVALNNTGSTWGAVDGVNGRTFGGGFFPAAGNVLGGSLNSVGSYGYYWSSTAVSSTNVYRLSFNSGDVSIGIGGRYSGFSVRCIAL